MVRIRLSVLTAAVLTASGLALTAHAGDFHHRHSADRSAIIGGDGLPSVVPGLGTFAGSIAAVRVKGNGIYFAVNRTPRNVVKVKLAPKAYIIEIDPENEDSLCSYEAGVCVIRP